MASTCAQSGILAAGLIVCRHNVARVSMMPFSSAEMYAKSMCYHRCAYAPQTRVVAGGGKRHSAAGPGGAGAASDQLHARGRAGLALATGKPKTQAKTGRFLSRPGAILTPMGIRQVIAAADCFQPILAGLVVPEREAVCISQNRQVADGEGHGNDPSTKKAAARTGSGCACLGDELSGGQLPV